VDQALIVAYNTCRKRHRLWRPNLGKIAYVNGCLPLSEAKVSVLDRGFLFADGIYGCRGADGKLIDNASHLARLERSVGEIKPAAGNDRADQEIRRAGQARAQSTAWVIWR
jgi:D-alanine transaminase